MSRKFALYSVLLFTACAPSYQNTFTMPEFTVGRLQFAQPAQITLNIYNPNSQNIVLKDAHITLFLEGDNQSSLSLPPTPLAAGSSKQLLLSMPLHPNSTEYLQDKNMSYRLDGDFTLDAGLSGAPHMNTYTLTQGLIPTSQIWQAPKYTLKDTNLALGEKTAKLTVQVEPQQNTVWQLPLELKVDNVTVAKTTPTNNTWVFDIDPLSIPTQLRTKSFSFSVWASPTLNFSGLDSLTLEPYELLSGTVK